MLTAAPPQPANTTAVRISNQTRLTRLMKVNHRTVSGWFERSGVHDDVPAAWSNTAAGQGRVRSNSAPHRSLFRHLGVTII